MTPEPEAAHDVAALRRGAHERAVARPRRPFAGAVEDLVRDGLTLRRYTPEGRHPGAAAVFLHGGYGLFGDLELQDGWCRRTAEALGVVVLSVDYRLAPEATLDDSVADALAAVDLLAGEGFDRLYLDGDSAGGTVATLAAARTGRRLAGLLLTNPNLDLSLETYDDTLPGGPGRELSTVAMRVWTGVEPSDALRLHRSAHGLPPTFVAVGDRDSLLPEARALTGSCRREGVPCRLVELPGAEHGFVGTERAGEVLAAARTFFDLG
ncbi:alpha/beta hydrolase [Krasilnikoviella flava]|uniref:Acetyl esterase n=1 Tax=Krasilnikoviella flava TaxID=526729 RepID=A0A1T5KDN5_9MICO|nr:alpha/beta hydrolase [Krasilnikoviella flava]SKC61777.1 acetyl esterase [Krasilnikoviella flava]